MKYYVLDRYTEVEVSEAECGVQRSCVVQADDLGSSNILMVFSDTMGCFRGTRIPSYNLVYFGGLFGFNEHFDLDGVFSYRLFVVRRVQGVYETVARIFVDDETVNVVIKNRGLLSDDTLKSVLSLIRGDMIERKSDSCSGT